MKTGAPTYRQLTKTTALSKDDDNSSSSIPSCVAGRLLSRVAWGNSGQHPTQLFKN